MQASPNSTPNGWAALLEKANFKQPKDKAIFEAFEQAPVTPVQFAASRANWHAAFTAMGIPEGFDRMRIETQLNNIQVPPEEVDTNSDGKRKRSKIDTVDSSVYIQFVENLYKKIIEVDLSSLSKANVCTKLPFPLTPMFWPPERFICQDGNFEFFGREQFLHFEKAARNFIFPTATADRTSGNHSHMMVYGNLGAGKSHMLMALGLMLRKEFSGPGTSRRVVVLPQASDFVIYGASYMQLALMLAFADDKNLLLQLAETTTLDGLKHFCDKFAGKLVFIVDQYESFEVGQSHESKRSFEAFVGPLNYIILGASANNDTAKARDQKQLRYCYYDVFGGLTQAEAVSWLTLCQVSLSGSQMDQLFDFSGGVPLFLMYFVRSISKFPCDTRADPNQFGTLWENVCSDPAIVQIITNVCNMMQDTEEEVAAAFLYGSQDSTFAKARYDRRYFYFSKHCECIAGFVRDSLCKALRQYKGGAQFLSSKWLARVRDEAESTRPNKSVLGFLVEQAVLSTISSTGISFGGKLRSFPIMHWFGSGDERDMLSRSTQSTIFLPTAFNYPDVDAVLVIPDFKQGKAARVGVQVTLAPYSAHSASAGQFMAGEKCSIWALPSTSLEDYDWFFLWIMPLSHLQSSKSHEHKMSITRLGATDKKVQVVAYQEQFMSLGSVNTELKIVDEKIK